MKVPTLAPQVAGTNYSQNVTLFAATPQSFDLVELLNGQPRQLMIVQTGGTNPIDTVLLDGNTISLPNGKWMRFVGRPSQLTLTSTAGTTCFFVITDDTELPLGFGTA